MKRIFIICAAAAGAVFAAVPTIRDGSVTFRQDAGRNVQIGYVLDGTSALGRMIDDQPHLSLPPS